jgi:hypothetical protein
MQFEHERLDGPRVALAFIVVANDVAQALPRGAAPSPINDNEPRRRSSSIWLKAQGSTAPTTRRASIA